jgi:hypothetical protein
MYIRRLICRNIRGNDRRDSSLPPSSKLKTGHCGFENRPLGSETGHYRGAPKGTEAVSWLEYLWATLIGFVVTVAIATSSAILILDLSRYVEPVSHGLVLGIDPGIWYGILIVAVCIFIGLFFGIFVGTTVGFHLYRRHQNSKPATADFKPGH